MSHFNKYRNINRNKPLKCTNFNRIRGGGNGQWDERQLVLDLSKNSWKKYCIQIDSQEHDITKRDIKNLKTDNISHNEYMINLSKYLFTICVHGGGIDVNPKLFEALLVGVIPIIRKNPPYTNIYKDLNLPVVMIDEWNENTITYDNLIKWKNKYYKYFENKDSYKDILNKLSLDYYVTYVSTI